MNAFFNLIECDRLDVTFIYIFWGGNMDFTTEFEDVPEAGAFNRFSRNANTKAKKLEKWFLGLLRYGALVLAAAALLAAIAYLVYGAAQQLRRTDLQPETVSISADDVVPNTIQSSTTQSANVEKTETDKKPTITAEVRRKTLSIYQARFRSFERNGEKISDNEIISKVWPDERIEVFDNLATRNLVGKEKEHLENGGAVMLTALSAVEEATADKGFQSQLSSYKNAKKAKVCTEVVKTRSREIEGWDSSSMSCESWYLSPIGCPVIRTIEEPYTDKSCAMKFPDELPSPSTQFANAIARYAVAVETKLGLAQLTAEEESAKNHLKKQAGMAHMGTAMKLFLGFMAVMFLYLFVAIERHHRTLREIVTTQE